MKKLFTSIPGKVNSLVVMILTLTAFAGINNSYGYAIHKPVNSSGAENMDRYLKVSEVVKLSAEDFGRLTGKKMNIWERASFTFAKIKMKHDLKKNPNLTLMDYTTDGSFHKGIPKSLKIIYYIILGFLLVFLILILAGSKQG